MLSLVSFLRSTHVGIQRGPGSYVSTIPHCAAVVIEISAAKKSGDFCFMPKTDVATNGRRDSAKTANKSVVEG